MMCSPFSHRMARMKWTVAGLAAICFLLAVFSATAEDEAEDEELRGRDSWYTSTVVSGRGGYRVTHYWSLGPALRSQTLVGVSPIVTIVQGDRYWAYNELLGEGIEVKRSAQAIAEDGKRGRPFGKDLEGLIRSGGERVETGLLSGVRAETWRVTNSQGRRTVWVRVDEPKVPLRVENFNRESGESATLSYSNWASGFEIPKEFFEPPANLRLRKFEYEAYVAESLKGPVGSAPILHPEMIHGRRPQ
jgi:hypothetical protein